MSAPAPHNSPTRWERVGLRPPLLLTTVVLYARWSKQAQSDQAGLVLVLPQHSERMRRCVLAIANAHRARGRAVRVIDADEPGLRVGT